MLVEYKAIKVDPVTLEPELDDDGHVVEETRTGKFLEWGVRTTIEPDVKVPLTNTIAIVEDMDGGSVIVLDPEEMRII